MIRQVMAKLENPGYYIVRDSKLYLSLLNSDHVIETFTDPFTAINSFYQRYVSEGAFVRQKHSVTSRLRNEIVRTRSWLDKTGDKLAELRNDDHYKSWGDLLMANLHLVKPEAKVIEVNDFYDPEKIVSIKLDPQVSAQKNAERFYRKGKNQQIEITKLTEGFQGRARELKKLEDALEKAEQAANIKALQAMSADWEVKTGTASVASVPYREFEFKGFRIWVGKDAKSNDALTLKYSFKEDLWLHVRDDTGSHVLLKYQAGKVFPKDVIERAASLAAWFSKRKTEPLCAVVVTPKKFIRKRKGDPAGAVVIEREEVVLVEPKSF
jgi:predicted ribosome quality control (RQC) complex YloA/Tae2 family protein